MNVKERLEDNQRMFGAFAEANSEVMGKFGEVIGAAFDGVLDAKTMELLIVVASVSRKCEPCIYSHVGALIEAGGTRAELVAALNAAILICGGPGMAYSAIALDVFDQLTAEA